VADERDKIRAMMGLPSTATKDPVVVGGTPFGQAGTAQAPQTPMSYGGTSFGQAGSAAPTTSNEYQSALDDFNKTLKQAEKTLAIAKKSGNKNQIKAAQGYVDLLKGDINQVLKIAGGISGGTAGAGVVNPGNRSDSEYVSTGSTGTSNTGKNYINGKLATAEEWSKFLYGDQKAAGASAGGVADADAREKRQSAFDLLKLQFDEYGLGALVEPLRGLIQEGISPSEFAVRLRQTEPYKKRFAANAARISKGLRALSESDYINLEDDYQTIMRNYGLPASYYTKGELGRQEGFEKFIGGDVSPAELEERIVTAQKRVLDAAPEVTTALKQFYPDIKNGEILAYTLDPEKGLADIRKKVTAAEIGGAALGAQLGATVGRAEELARYGVTAESARAGYGAIGGGLERGRQLADIYQQPDYTQAVAEEEVFNLPGQAGATQKRKKIIGMEKATFGGQTGITSGALSRDRAGSY
jgi:hypothetical protein